jgi:hypothetical protein
LPVLNTFTDFSEVRYDRRAGIGVCALSSYPCFQMRKALLMLLLMSFVE